MVIGGSFSVGSFLVCFENFQFFKGRCRVVIFLISLLKFYFNFILKVVIDRWVKFEREREATIITGRWGLTWKAVIGVL